MKKLKGNVSRCDRKIIMWAAFLTSVDAALTAHLTRAWSQFARFHSWMWTRTVPHYNSRRRDVHLMNPRVSGQTSLHYIDTGPELCSFQQARHHDRRPQPGIQEVSTALLWEKWKHCSGSNILRTPKTNPLPGPTGIHTMVEIRECIYEHLAVVQWGQWTDRAQGEIPAPLYIPGDMACRLGGVLPY